MGFARARPIHGLFDIVRYKYTAPAVATAGRPHASDGQPRGDGSGLHLRSWPKRNLQLQERRRGARARRCCTVRLRRFPVSVLFRPVIEAQAGPRDGYRLQAIFCLHPGACGETRAAGLCPAALFFSCYLQGFTGTGGALSSPPPCSGTPRARRPLSCRFRNRVRSARRNAPRRGKARARTGLR